MSTIKTNAILDASGGNTTTINGTTPTAYNTMGKNLVINGDMRIDQRNAGASVTPASGTYSLDRMRQLLTQTGKYSVQQVTDAPDGFTNSLKVTSLSAYAVISSDYFLLNQHIEANNIPQLAWGTTNAKTVTLSFWIKSSLTGAFGGSFLNTGATTSYPFSYTISSANTWEKKTITIAGDTTGTWASGGNGIGIRVYFSLGTGTNHQNTAGSWYTANLLSSTGETSVVGTSGATWQITGVQLEVGSVATEFERRPYTTELQLCQRYYEKSYNIGTVPGTNTTTGIAGYIVMANSTTSLANNGTNAVVFKVYKRTTPTITTYDSVGNSGKLSYVPAGIGRQDNITSGVHRQAEGGFGVYTTSASSLTAGQAVEQFHQWTADAEL